MSIKTISGAIVIGIKFLAIYFILFAAQQMAAGMGDVLKNFSIADLTPMWTCFGMAGLLAFLALKVPQMVADLLNGTVSLSGGDAMAAAAVGGGAVAAIAGGAAALAGGAANGVGGAIKAGGAAIEQAKASGASGLGGITAGAVSALGSAGLGATADVIKGIGGGATSGNSMAERIGTKTARITETRAAGTPAASVPGGQPAAPASPQRSNAGQSLTSANDGTSNSPAIASTRATPAAPDATPTSSQLPPPQSATHSIPAVSAAENVNANQVNRPQALASQPAGSGTGTSLANNLVNELKQADRAHGAAVSIQAPGHD